MPKSNIEHIRHSLAHLLAAAVLELWPDAKPTIGPAIENGFYYDFKFQTPISDSDLPKIEKKMRHLLPTWEKFTAKKIDKKEALAVYKDNAFKRELVEEIADKEEDITAQLPLPEYKEVAPTSWLEKIFAGLSVFLTRMMESATM